MLCTPLLAWWVSPLRTLVLGAGVDAPGSSGLVPERVKGGVSEVVAARTVVVMIVMVGAMRVANGERRRLSGAEDGV